MAIMSSGKLVHPGILASLEQDRRLKMWLLVSAAGHSIGAVRTGPVVHRFSEHDESRGLYLLHVVLLSGCISAWDSWLHGRKCPILN